MSKPTFSPDQALRKLRADGEALAWPQRRALAGELSAKLAAGERPAPWAEWAKLLLDDPQPEVRKEAVDLLYYLPEDDFSKFAAQLANDTSFFVQKALERVLDRRRKGARASQRARRNLSEIEAQLGSIEKFHGKLAAERARKLADKQFDILVGETVHDLRNILSPIKVSVSTLLSQLNNPQAEPKECRETVGRMRERVDYLERFIGDMRQYSQACNAPKHRERILEVVLESKTLAQDALKAHGREISKIAPEIAVPEAITAEVARHQMLIALVHLIKNAYESFEMLQDKKRARRVEILAKVEKDRRLALSVSDNGPGIHEEDLEEYRQFTPGRTTKKSYGTGFGLPTAQRCAEAHNGTLTIESTLREGSTVTIHIPLETEDEEP